MTLGTSPLPLGAAPSHGAEAEGLRADHRAWIQRQSLELRAARAWLTRHKTAIAKSMAVVYLAALVALSMTAWSSAQAAGDAGILSGLASGVLQVHLAFLIVAGAGMAFTSLRPSRKDVAPATVSAPPCELSGLGDLLAQMSHELRTPLNAVIGFSEVMRQEMLGPLGNVRYQEYAHHISVSGGQMLRSSLDAIAVAEAMTLILGRTQAATRSRVGLAKLVEDACALAQVGPVRMAIPDTFSVVCEPKATLQSVEHLLREAANRAGAEAAIEVQADGRRLDIRAPIHAASSAECDHKGLAGGLNIVLARLLLEAQGARLAVSCDGHTWRGSVTFP